MTCCTTGEWFLTRVFAEVPRVLLTFLTIFSAAAGVAEAPFLVALMAFLAAFVVFLTELAAFFREVEAFFTIFAAAVLPDAPFLAAALRPF